SPPMHGGACADHSTSPACRLTGNVHLPTLRRSLPHPAAEHGVPMFDSTTTLLWLSAFAACFALAGIAYSQRHRSDLEDYVVARNSQGRVATVLTLLASSLGAWILFAPAQAATWGGIAAVTGYALGALSPRIAMIPLGRRMRTLIP